MVNTIAITLQKVHGGSIVNLFGNIYVKLYYISRLMDQLEIMN